MSKGLKALERLVDYILINENCIYIADAVRKDKEIIETQFKAFEIIKNKKVNTHSWYYNNCNKMPYEIYKQSIMVKTISDGLLTEEEYDLLKETLL